MCGNGVRIGMEVTLPIHRQTRQVLEVGLTAWSVVAAGTATRGAGECRIATTARPTAGAATLAFACAFQLVNRELDLDNR